MNSRQFRVAACQYPIERVSSFEQWVSKVRSWVAEASAAGAQVLLFPEYGSCDTLDLVGRPSSTLRDLLQLHQTLLPQLSAHYAELAREYAVLIVAGSWFEAVGSGFRNRTRVFAPNHNTAFADKVMLTPEERRYDLLPGESSSLLDTSWGRIGIAVCYDCEFPILVRRLVEAGAELILVPSCTDTLAGYHRVRIACQARALESQCYVVQAVTVGDAPWSLLLDTNRGAAGVYGPPDVGFPADGIVAAGTLDRPQWVYGDIDLDLLQRTRANGQVRGREDWSRPEHLSAAVIETDLR